MLTTNQKLAIRRRRIRNMFLDMFLVHKTSTSLPLEWRVIKDVEDLKPILSMLVLQPLQVRLEKDVVNVDVRVNKRDPRHVQRIAKTGADDLNHWCNAGTTRYHCEVLDEVGGVKEGTFWTFEADLLTWSEKRDVF